MEFVVLFIVGYIGAITPGPDILLVMHNSLRFGAFEGLKVLSGIATGWLVFLGIVYFGLTQLLSGDIIQVIIGLIGGLYLLYIAFSLYRKSASSIDMHLSGTTSYLKALIVNLSNPKAILFFGVIVTPFIDKNLGISLIVLFFSLLSAFLTIIVIAICCKQYLSNKTFYVIDKICSLLFFIFSLSLFYHAIEIIRKYI